ncbi:uncharacterized protein BCR38DRAFT_444965 [Pseudomassariella vexata]|uniref:Uncharacterized protein n=1 Tax=Pseudomassariella vexata TaxID=1141098 RepID=A0A1Y2DK49_9PEZI|nr:uncharacterized protein BCR38DRAFT_444965 [Pseudomassariella vexata]ORY59581.1 hypothetical protein BCR38DRAFT_444965 [Pseudomassariella vexata]
MIRNTRIKARGSYSLTTRAIPDFFVGLQFGGWWSFILLLFLFTHVSHWQWWSS